LIARNLTKTQLLLWSAAVVYVAAIGVATVGATQATPKAPAGPAMPADASGEQIFAAACATCHAANGTGSPKSIVGFDIANGHSLPDFTDCATNTVEPLADWVAVAHEGGPVRGLDRHMPAFGQALTIEQIERTIKYLWSFCDDGSWPRGDLNFPRAFFTEKAFPESESVITTGVTTSGPKSVTNQIVYEHRIGSRGQYEVSVPIDMQQVEDSGSWNSGIGDIELALRRTFFHSVDRGSIFAVGAAVALPTGSEERGLGNGYTIVEPFAMFGQMIGSAGFLQIHTGIEIPTDQTTGQNEAFVRTALGYSFAQDRGFGRAWSPMMEVLVAKPSGGSAEWDVVPQMQVSLSKLQHILISVGARLPLNEREERKPQFLTYFLWDWFDGGLFQFWK
jgi:mono/diheme cytochrome c family protein